MTDEDTAARRRAAGRTPSPMNVGAALRSSVAGDVAEFGPTMAVVCMYCGQSVILPPFVWWLVRMINRRLSARDERELGPRDVAVCERNAGACMKLWQADRASYAAKVVREMHARQDEERRRAGSAAEDEL